MLSALYTLSFTRLSALVSQKQKCTCVMSLTTESVANYVDLGALRMPLTYFS